MMVFLFIWISPFFPFPYEIKDQWLGLGLGLVWRSCHRRETKEEEGEGESISFYYLPTVSGMVGSAMVHITSTKGTLAMAHLNKPGFWFNTAPINKPPALRPQIPRRSLIG